jgi:hypothetical protein
MGNGSGVLRGVLTRLECRASGLRRPNKPTIYNINPALKTGLVVQKLNDQKRIPVVQNSILPNSSEIELPFPSGSSKIELEYKNILRRQDVGKNEPNASANGHAKSGANGHAFG